MEMKTKTTLRMLVLLAIITCSMVAPILVQRYMASAWKLTAEQGSYDPDYMSISGVLSTDSYVLFPFQKKNLTIGFSKYGEMIDYDLKVGMDYGGATDPWAPNTDYVAEYEWVEGWEINITYWHEDTFYNRWAFALYSDYSGTSGIGGDWHEDVQGGALNTTVKGGRKTNGGAVTDDIRVLYNGPRRFVAFLKTTLYESSSHTNPLVTVSFTIVFDKVKKQAVWFKDIKRIESPKRWGDMQVEFAERGQWDLASDTGESVGSAPKSYACFFPNQTTVYNASYQSWYTSAPTGYNGVYDVAQIIDDQLDYVAWAAYWPKPIIHWVDDIGSLSNKKIYTTSSTVEQNWTGTGSLTTFTCNLHGGPVQYPRDNILGSWSETPMVFVGNDHQTEGADADFTYSADTDTITFNTAPSSGADIRAYYKVDDGNNDVPGTGIEPCSPFTNAEWCFELDAASEMFRCVTAFGVTDRNDGDDADRAVRQTDLLDNEIQYYLNQTFNPYDLYDAVHKQEYRWVKKDTLTSALTAGTNYTLTSGLDDSIYTLSASHATFNATWVNEYEDGVDAHSKNWAAKMEVNCTAQADQHTDLKIVPPGAGTTLTFKDIVDLDFWYYLYSSPSPTYGPHICVYLSKTGGRTSGECADITMYTNVNTTTSTWLHVTLPTIADYVGAPLGGDPSGDRAFHIFYDSAVAADWNSETQGPTNCHSLNYWQGLNGSVTEDYIVDYIQVELGWWSSGQAKALIDDVSIGYLSRTSGIKYQRVYNLEEDKLIPCNWSDYCTFAEKVLINGTLAIPYRANVTNPIFDYYNYTVNFETGNITFRERLGVGTYLKILYSTIEENEKGRYEWIVVGNGAASIDSLGAAYITEAFDSTKDIAVALAGMDINDTSFGPHSPFVMGGATSGTKSDYKDSLNRTHLGDDWCNTTAISSSNMIFAGGPIAQMGTDYFNEFTDAFFVSSLYVINNTGCEEAHSDKILALSCWNRNVSASGYAVVAVHKDLNGTIGLVIWGFDGDDTYYASKWFWDGQGGTAGIEYLQSINRGVTAIVLKITYSSTDPTHPTVSIVERLGTISEKDQHDP
jgi:hypothetical protein